MEFVDKSFCAECGTLLPTPGAKDVFSCPRCNEQHRAADFEGIKITSKTRPYAFQKPKFNTGKNETREGTKDPKVDEACPKCGKHEMTFTTAQLRSADEGQTIFYTCQACGHKYQLNS
eukprot:m.75764 g.75764  ORF g.75764 m.75764 type:complete len:118 (+) comp12521_c0_seq2:109-462(+)